MNDFLKLQGNRILVTGASSGIGRKTAIMLSEQGAEVIIVGRNEKNLDDTYQMLEGNGHMKIVTDLTNYDEYSDWFKEITSEKKLNGMVHCAGVAMPVPAKMVSEKLIKTTFDINFVAFMELVKHFIKPRNSKGGSIVAVSSQMVYSPHKCMSIYSASKGAIEGAVKALAYELMDKGYRVNSVVPGPVDTEMSASTGEQYGTNIQEGESLGMVPPEDVANVIAFLLSDASKYITGRDYFVDGGRLV